MPKRKVLASQFVFSYKKPLKKCKLHRRNNLYSAEVSIDNEKELVHIYSGDIAGEVGNAGVDPPWPALLYVPEIKDGSKTKRKYRYSLELVHNGQCWVCVNTQRANDILFTALDSRNPILAEFAAYDCWRREVKYGTSSRIDLVGVLRDGSACEPALKRQKRGESDHGKTAAEAGVGAEAELKKCFIEVKMCVLRDGEDGRTLFCNTRTARAEKHIGELIKEVKKGNRAVVFFLVTRNDGKGFKPCDQMDSEMAESLRHGKQEGVEIVAYECNVQPKGVQIIRKIDDILL